jgi:hypothetical protein
VGDFLTMLVLVGAYVVVMRYVLPKAGVET